MALRNVTVGDAQPINLQLDEHLSLVRAEGEVARQLVAALAENGWRHVAGTELNGPDREFAGRLVSARSSARLGVQVAEAFLQAAHVDAARLRDRSSTLRSELAALEGESAEVADVRDLLLDELGRGPVRGDRPLTTWTELAGRLGAMGHIEAADELVAWTRRAAAGAAPRHPRALELEVRWSDLEERWQHAGAGSFQSSPEITSFRDERDRLRELVAELERQVTSGLRDTTREEIEAAHVARVRAEDAGGVRRGGAIAEARSEEDQLLARYGYANYPDFQIATSTGSVADHARLVLAETTALLDAAGKRLTAAISSAEALGARIERDRNELEAVALDLGGGSPLANLLEVPSSGSDIATQLAEHGAAVATRIMTLEGELASVERDLTELEREIGERTADLQLAQQLAAEIDEVVGLMDAEFARAMAALCGVLDDPSVPGVVLDGELAWLDSDRLLATLSTPRASQVVFLAARDDLPTNRVTELG